MEGTEKPEYGKVVDIVTRDSLRELVTPGLLAVMTPIAVGFGLGVGALGSYLAGTIATGVLMAEAPTGVGKSVAYLLPAVMHAAETDQRVVVATCTKSLQDQLFERDLPAVLEALGVSIPIARLKGKANYLCPRLLDIAEADRKSTRLNSSH